MSYQVPYSSSPAPSTPDRKSTNAFSFGANPSTTPAGPPPSSTGSFTPAGPPPSSAFGSSMIDSPLKPLSFSQQSGFNPKSSPPTGYRRSAVPSQPSGLSNEYQASLSRTSRSPSNGSDEYEGEEYTHDSRRFTNSQQYAEDDADGMTDDDAQYQDDVQYEDDADMADYRATGRTYDQRSSPTSGSLKRSRETDLMDLGMSIIKSGARPDTSEFEKIAKDLYSEMPIPPLNESDEVILNTEATITKLYGEDVVLADDEDVLVEALTAVSGEFMKIWDEYQSKTVVYDTEEYSATIGPSKGASNFEKANFLAGLALQIQHPEKISKSFDRKVKPLPQAMLEWEDEQHNPFPSFFEEVQGHKPSPANHQLFWEAIFNNLLRGKVVAVVRLLGNAGWRTARTETDGVPGSFGQMGFTGPALSNVEKVINAAAQVLSQCPAARGDWNIRSSDWTLFRLRAKGALQELQSFAEGRNRDHNESTYNPEGFGTNSVAGSYSINAKKAESRVPWNIYQHLVTLYSLVMGDATSIIENAQDWCEATIGLLVWWDESRDDRRLAHRQSQSRFRAAARETDAVAFRGKLRRSFQAATASNTDFQVNTADTVEVALTSLFEGDFESVVGFLRGWSVPVSAAVAEIASLGGWLPQSEEKNLINMGDLDQDDMDVLNFNAPPSKADGVKDKTLIIYARLLPQRKDMKTPRMSAGRGHPREGWELSIAILGRLDSAARSEETIGEFLKNFSLDSAETVDKLWKLLNQLDMNRQAESIAESYADSLAEASHRYGEALWYYALAHKNQKVKDVLDLLISFSLIQSTAYPPESELDDHLRNLVSSPKNALTQISKMDLEAAELLHKMLSGYATLRRFYDLRDEEFLSANRKSNIGLVARKLEASASLMAVITSSSDNIRGGLYDEERGAVVSVDFLLALLGEALVFVNQPETPITVTQIDVLLKAIEDLQSVGPRVYSACTEFLQTVVASGQGLKGSTPFDMLRKSTSNGSGMSSFSMVGSSMLASQLKQSMSSSGVMIRGNIKRGWDWRQCISAGTGGDEVLRILRLGLARDLAKAYLAEADGLM